MQDVSIPDVLTTRNLTSTVRERKEQERKRRVQDRVRLFQHELSQIKSEIANQIKEAAGQGESELLYYWRKTVQDGATLEAMENVLRPILEEYGYRVVTDKGGLLIRWDSPQSN